MIRACAGRRRDRHRRHRHRRRRRRCDRLLVGTCNRRGSRVGGGDGAFVRVRGSTNPPTSGIGDISSGKSPPGNRTLSASDRRQVRERRRCGKRLRLHGALAVFGGLNGSAHRCRSNGFCSTAIAANTASQSSSHGPAGRFVASRGQSNNRIAKSAANRRFSASIRGAARANRMRASACSRGAIASSASNSHRSTSSSSTRCAPCRTAARSEASDSARAFSPVSPSSANRRSGGSTFVVRQRAANSA